MRTESDVQLMNSLKCLEMETRLQIAIDKIYASEDRSDLFSMDGE